MTQNTKKNLKDLSQKEILHLLEQKCDELTQLFKEINEHTEFEAFGTLAAGVEKNNKVSACISLHGGLNEISSLFANHMELNEICMVAISRHTILQSILESLQDDE